MGYLKERKLRKIWIVLLVMSVTLMAFAEGRYEFVKEFEQFSSKAYWDVNRYAIGYGTKAQTKYQVISKEEATAYFDKEISNIERRVKIRLDNYGIKYNDEMLRAITSFEYNLGYQKKQWNRLKQGNLKAYANNMISYNKVNGKVLNGLTKRRKAEKVLFLNGYNKIDKK